MGHDRDICMLNAVQSGSFEYVLTSAGVIHSLHFGLCRGTELRVFDLLSSVRWNGCMLSDISSEWHLL